MAKFVIIGASSSGYNAAVRIRELDDQAEIVLVSEEDFLPYRRDKLLDFLGGVLKEEQLYFAQEDFFKSRNITFLRNKKVSLINPEKKTLYFKEKGTLDYDHLIIASGRRMDQPDIPGIKKRGVFDFYSLDGYKEFSNFLVNQPVCLFGGDDFAYQAAIAISKKFGVEVKLITEESAQGFLPCDGIEIIQAKPTEVIGESQVQAVKLSTGKAIGVCAVVCMDNYKSNIEFFKGLSVEAQDGRIVVDPAMRTALKDVYACGSVATVKGAAIKIKNHEECAQEGLKVANGFYQKQTPAATEPADLLAVSGAKGAEAALKLARQRLEEQISQKGQSAGIFFPETNYHLPLIHGLLNIEVKSLNDCLEVLKQAEALNSGTPASSGLKLEILGGILNKGLVTLLCEELLAALAYLTGEHPKSGIGFIPDKILRSLGLQLVDGRISGIAVILGPAKDENAAVGLVRSFQSKGIVSLLAGNVAGATFRKQLESQGVQLGLENYIVELGEDYLSAIYAVNFAVRAPLIYGNNKPGQWQSITDYMRNRVPAFILLLGFVDELLVSTGLGAIALGLPVITDQELPQLGKIDTTLFEALATEKDYQNLVSRCIVTRGIKVKMAQVEIPLPYAPAFEGERVRREQMAAEFGAKTNPSLEFLTSKEEPLVNDGQVELFGPDIDQLDAQNSSLPLAIIVDVFGRKMQKDFEPILERQIHRFFNYAMGVMHMGQRDMNWIRISRDAFDKGFRLRHLGVILHAMLHQEYSNIVDKVQVKIYTRQEDVDRFILEAKKVFHERDMRIAGMTDENVDTFFSCLLCQSFAPNHVCVVTPERLGLCGAYSWLDAKASFEITPTGPNQPILKGNLVDQRLGEWENINIFVNQKSNKTIDRVSMYSLMEAPQSSCGCFECIVAIIPEANGVMVVNRDFPGLTPSGMSFTTLAGSVGGGVQTPGFLGVGKLYLLSKKFISAEGGLKRLVWMPLELKQALGERLVKRCEEIGEPGLVEKIADETVATTAEELVAYLEKCGHPALKMEPMI